MNVMRELRIEKVCINIGAGEPGDKLNKAKKVLKILTGKQPIETKSKKKIPAFNLRAGIPIGAKVTLRRNFNELIKRLLAARENQLNAKAFSNKGVSFGIDEYLHIPGMDYDPELGIMGMDVTINFERKGFRVARRNFKIAKIGKKHLITPEECMEFMKKNYGAIIK